MTCKHVKELILTDYLDGELDGQRMVQIGQHLASCAVCRKFLTETQKIAVEPFLNAKTGFPSQEKVWQNIRERVEQKQSRSNPFVDFVTNLKQTFTLPKPAFFLLSSIIVILVVSIYLRPLNHTDVIQSISFVQNHDTDLSYAVSDFLDEENNDNMDYGTTIEKYFL